MTEQQIEQQTEKAQKVFGLLNAINVNENKSQKNNLDYLSWAWSWQVAKKEFPLTKYHVYENKNEWNYHTDGKTAWVKVGVTIEGLEHIEYLPVMDFKNKSIPLDKVTSMDVNKAIQRALVKAIARHGLGLYIYAGEDLPDLTEEQIALEKEKARIRAVQPLLKRAEELGYKKAQLDEIKGYEYEDVKNTILMWEKERKAKEAAKK